MKKQYIAIIILLLMSMVLSLTLLACKDNKEPQFFNVSYEASAGGTIIGKITQSIEKDKSGTAVTAVANTGYKFIKWSDGKTENPRTDKNVTQTIEVTAEFEKLNFLVQYSAGLGGSISGTQNQDIVYGEDATTVTAVADTHYEFEKWSDGKIENPRTDTNVIAAIEVAAIFQKKSFLVIYNASSGGTVTGSKIQNIAYGENATAVTAVADIGYEFVKWSDNNTYTERTDFNVVSIITVTALFQKINYTITYTAGTGGAVTGSKIQNIAYGENATAVTAVADIGYEFVKWSDNDNTNPVRTDTNITSAITANALFQKKSFAITYTASAGGYITGEKTQTVIYGENASKVTAIADIGYEFEKWSDNDSTNPVRTDTNITSAITATAVFQKQTFTVKYLADMGGSIEGNKTQTIEYGGDATTVTAVPNTGYEFVKWSDNSSTNPVRTDTNVTAAIMANAIFQKQTFTVKYLANAGGYIVGESTQTVAYGESSTEVIVNINPGYMFTEWSDGYGFHKRIDHNITANITVTAKFEFLFGGGDGSVENPFLIDSYNQLLMINIFPDSHYKLNKDLDLQGINHLPMFSIDYMFNGSFDGNNKIISNMTVYRYIALPSLFGAIGKQGSVKNLNITDFNIQVPISVIDNENASTPQYVGAIAGVSYGKLTNIKISGEITAKQLDNNAIYIGGIVGRIENIIENCHADIEIFCESNGANNSLIVGGMAAVIAHHVISCSASGNIIITYTKTKANRSIGGLFAFFYDMGYVSEFYIKNSHSSVDINVKTESTCGGFAVSIFTSLFTIIENCYATGNVITADGDAYGFAETIGMKTGSVINCYSSGNVKGYYATGFAGMIANGSNDDDYVNVINCHSSGNVEGEWEAMGFVNSARCVNFYRTYSSGDVRGYDAYGFARLVTGLFIEECFSTGDVYGYGSIAGFIHLVTGRPSGVINYIKNCYSTSNIYILNAYPESTVSVGGFISSLTGRMINCYYAGKISGTSIGDLEIGGIIRIFRATAAEIINCHWVKYPDGLADVAIYDNRGDEKDIEIEEYSDITELYSTETFSFADILNNGNSELIWADVECDTPQLKFMLD